MLENLIWYIYIEISEEVLYEGGCIFEEIIEFLKFYGFKLKNMFFNYKNWGNVFYIKEYLIEINEIVIFNIVLNKLIY